MVLCTRLTETDPAAALGRSVFLQGSEKTVVGSEKSRTIRFNMHRGCWQKLATAYRVLSPSLGMYCIMQCVMLQCQAWISLLASYRCNETQYKHVTLGGSPVLIGACSSAQSGTLWSFMHTENPEGFLNARRGPLQEVSLHTGRRTDQQ